MDKISDKNVKKQKLKKIQCQEIIWSEKDASK